MESPEKSVAYVSRAKANKYYQKENFGRAFAHILLAVKLCPTWKNDLKSLFTSSLCHWGEELETKGRYSDLFNCYEQAIEVFPENEEVVNNLGAHLFRTGHLNEASVYFHSALKIKPDYIPAYRNLQSVSNLLVERWHFRMLNDSHRNEAYREAVFKKISQGFDFVLDIGTGTGLLSYFAVDSGTQDVFACDYSQTMIDIAEKIAFFNGKGKFIKFICKLSNDLVIPDDLPRRVSLVVTETMDAGLFGEHLLQTLIYAWRHLLLPPLHPSTLVPPVPCIICRDIDSCQTTRRNGIVLPFGASLWFAAVECSDITRKYRLLSDKRNSFDKLKFPFLLTADTDEPYDCENLKRMCNGYKFLCEPVNCFYVNFNDVDELQDFFDGKNDDHIFNIKCTGDGSLDCFAFWFDLHLDEDIKLSSSPNTADENSEYCCWDQAIFPIRNEFLVTSDTTIDIKVKTKNGKLGLEVVNIHQPSSSFSDREIFTVSQEVVRFLNCSSVMHSYHSAISLVKNKDKILDFSPFPVLNFNFLRDITSSCTLVHVAKSENELNAVNQLAFANKIDLNCFSCILENTLETNLTSEYGDFDLIVANLIDSSGELRESSIVQLPKLRKLLKPGGKILPEKISVWGQLISSRWLRRSSEVISEGLIKKYFIALFINKHKVSYQLDVNVPSLEHSVLSEEFEIMQLTIDDLLERTNKEFHFDVPVITSGEATAVVYWFHHQLVNGCEIFSTKDVDSNVNQVAVMIEENCNVFAGDTVKISGKFSEAGFIFLIK